MRPIVFRDRDFTVIDQSAPLLFAVRHKGLERVDIWPARDNRLQCQIGFAFDDGTTGIGDIPWSAAALSDWLTTRAPKAQVNIHTEVKS